MFFFKLSSDMSANYCIKELYEYLNVGLLQQSTTPKPLVFVICYGSLKNNTCFNCSICDSVFLGPGKNE